MLLVLTLFFNIAFGQVVIIDDFSTQKSHGYQVKQVLATEFSGEIITLSADQYQESLKKVLEIKPLVLNLSFGTSEYNTAEIELLKQISAQGTFIIVAAGNNNQKVNMYNPVYPCFYPIDNLICVGASQGKDKAVLSNFGPKVKVFTNGQFKKSNVTSFAAPRVSAFVATALKCHNNPVDLINLQTISVGGNEVSWIGDNSSNFCYKYSSRDPF